MIIYGTKSSHLKTSDIAGSCANCGTENSMQLGAYQKYAHIFWIPLFPLSKVYITQCNHCKQVLTEKEIRNTYRISYEDMKNQLHTPWWTFVGLGLIGLAIVSAVISDQRKAGLNKTLIESPLQGDVYDLKTKEGQYTLLKVDQVIGDTVYLLPNEYMATQLGGLTKLKSQGDTTYSDDSYPILKSKLVKMFEDKEIIDISR